MNNISGETKTKIRALRGAPLTLLLVLQMIGFPAKNKDLENITGYTDKTIAKGLRALSDAGFVALSAGLWVLTPGGRQMILAGPIVTEPAQLTGNFPTLPTTTINIDSNHNLKESSSNPEKIRLPDLDPEIVDILRAAGVGEPTRSRLAVLDHVNADYLRAHVDQWKRDPDPRKRRPGLLITRIQNADPAPDVDRGEWDPNRYITGPFADMVDH